MVNIDSLIENTLLKPISPHEMKAYLNDGSFKQTEYCKNNVIHFDGEMCSKLEIILSGKIAIERIDQSGNLLTVADFYTGDVLGGNLLFSKNSYYPMTVTTRQHSVILEISKNRLIDLLCKNPEFLLTYLEFVSDNAAILGDKIKHYVNKTIRESLINFMKYEYKRQGSNPISLGQSKKALAENIGVQRTSLSRELAKMKKDGLVTYDANSVTIRDMHILKN